MHGAAANADRTGVSGRVQFVRAGARAAGGQSKVYLNPLDMSSAQISAGASVAVLVASQEEDGAKRLLACGVAWPMDKVKRRGVGLSAMWEAAVAAQAEVAVVSLVSSAAATATAVALQVVAPQRRWPGGSGGGDAPSTRERALLTRYVQAMLNGVLLHPGALLALPVHGVTTTLRVLRVNGSGRQQQTRTPQDPGAAVTSAIARVSASSTQVSIRWDPSIKDEEQELKEEKEEEGEDDGLTAAMGTLSVDPASPNATGSSEGFAAVGGLQKEIKSIREVIEQPLVNPGLFRKFGLPAPKGVLMFGPPGTGKTLIARALASELRARIFFVNGPEVMSKFVGESEANLRAVFARAARAAPALIFIDEIDALCPKRDARVGDMEKRLVATLLTLMDGLEGDAAAQDRHVVVLGATNRANALDPAIRRPGRFDREVEIGIPSAADRLDILRVTLRRLPHALADEQLQELAASAHGYVGADLSALCKEAALLALHRAFGQSDGAGQSSNSDNPLRAQLPPFRIELADLRRAMRGVRPSALRELAVEVPRVFWRDIGGQQALKQQLREAVEWPLAHPEAFVRLGIRPPKGVLLYGPPGCSKTLAAKALATESQMNFLAVKGPELFSKWVGESERAVQQLFRKARAAAPTVVFFDEIDALASSSRGGAGGGSSQVADRVLSQLLTELDGVEPLRQVLVVAATNRPDLLDPALLRPGRIDRALFVGPPDVQGREEILEVHTRRLPLADDVKLAELAIATARFSGAELAALCREAAMAAIDEQREGAERVAKRHFLRALGRVRPQIDDAMLAFFEGFRSQRK